MSQGYGGDETLARLLKDARAEMGVTDVRALVAGVLAAPTGTEPDAWMALAAPAAPDGLKAQLRALATAMAAEGKDGLGETSPARLAALRAELARRGLAGFVVPLADEHQGEYVARRARRLAWLTGFTGSFGVAVVLAGKAAIFVDGRYTLQVEHEVDGASFERHHYTNSPPDAWIAANLPAGGKLSFDPWLHTKPDVERLGNAARKAGGSLVPTQPNPVDAVWEGQPPAPVAPVVPLDDAFTGRSSADKRHEVGAVLERGGADACVLSDPASIAWLLNVRGGDVPNTPLPLSFAIARRDATVDLFIDGRKLTAATRAHLGNGVAVRRPDELGPALDALAKEGRKVQAEPRSAPYWVFDRLKAAGAEALEGPDPTALPKARKNDTELNGIRAAHARDGVALARFLGWLDATAARGGLTEIAVADRLYTFRGEGEHYRGPSFDTIAGAGPNGAVVHYHATPKTNRPVEPGTLLLVDSGGQYLDGTTDVTRTVAVGTPTKAMRRHFTAVLKGHIALARARFPAGTSGAQLDAIARLPLWQLGLDYDHGTGHGVGHYLGVHEGPQRISKVPNTVALEPGMVVSNEPGYYRVGAYGIRIENLVAVTPVESGEDGRAMLGFETLTKAPIDLNLVDPAMLDADERAWLDAYHADVAATVGPKLDAAGRAWLAQATRPLAG